MANYKLVVLTNAREGRDSEYNTWYNEVHLADVVAIPGFVSAQRFELKDPAGFEHNHRYLAIYEVNTDDPTGVMKELLGRQGTDAMVISEALDIEGAICGLFEACSPVVANQGLAIAG